MRRLFLVPALSSLLWMVAAGCAPEERWWKGNTHTHTLWSDGDAAPELIAAWYKEHGYHFLVLSDHNQIQVGERWFPVSEDGSARLKPAELDALVATFGADQVTVREVDGQREMRLLTLDELRTRFDEPGKFLFVLGEEVTAHYRTTEEQPRDLPVHVNAVNIEGYIPPRGGDSVVDLLNDTVDAIAAHGREAGRPVLAHLNHPNFGWGLTWEEVAQIRGDRFFEVYNGHRSVRNHGDAEHPGTEEIWDRALVWRLTSLGLGPLYGVATDDSHNYHGHPTSQPGRGWLMVRASSLDGDALVNAMRDGDFYASSGVTLDDVVRGSKSYSVDVATEEGVQYTVRFIGARGSGAETGPPGEVLLETSDDPAVYEYEGDELYVRAVVISSRDHPNPYEDGDKEMAWCQPHVPRR